MDDDDEKFADSLRPIRATGSMGLSPRLTVLKDLLGATMPPKHRTHHWGPLADDPWMALAVEGDIVKNELLRRAGGYLEEELAANWLGMTTEELRQRAEAGDLLAVSFDGRLLVPAFQLRNSMTLLRSREILAELPIRSPWRRLEWWLTSNDALGGQTHLEAFQRGREAEVREIARSHGAD
jgi:hypothetical protein